MSILGVRLNVRDDHAWLAVRALARLNVLLEHRVAVVVGHHQLSLEGNLGVLPARGDQFGPEREVGSKIPIHNVELNPVHTSRFGDAAVRAYQRSIAIS